MHPLPRPSRDDVAAALHRLYIGADGARLRHEDEKKVVEVHALLGLLRALLPTGRGHKKPPFVLVDACAGKSVTGVLAAELLLSPLRKATGRAFRVVVLERDPGRAQAARTAAANREDVDVIEADVDDEGAWPAAPDLVVALHACGAAADAILARATAAGAARLVVVPCCYGRSAGVPLARRPAVEPPPQATADAVLQAWGAADRGLVQRRLAQGLIDLERTLFLESRGYQTEVSELVPSTVTPHNLVFVARRVAEPVRMARASADLHRLHQAGVVATLPPP